MRKMHSKLKVLYARLVPEGRDLFGRRQYDVYERDYLARSGLAQRNRGVPDLALHRENHLGDGHGRGQAGGFNTEEVY